MDQQIAKVEERLARSMTDCIQITVQSLSRNTYVLRMNWNAGKREKKLGSNKLPRKSGLQKGIKIISFFMLLWITFGTNLVLRPCSLMMGQSLPPLSLFMMAQSSISKISYWPKTLERFRSSPTSFRQLLRRKIICTFWLHPQSLRLNKLFSLFLETIPLILMVLVQISILVVGIL